MRIVFTVIVAAILPLAGCGGNDKAETASATIEVTALAGPVCPVETDPPTPGCEPRAVENATIVVTDSVGNEVARGTTAADGTAVLSVPAGDLIVTPQPVEGLLGTAAELAVFLADGQTVQVTADYDTGIR